MAQRSKFIGAPSRNELWAPQEVAVSSSLATRTRKEIAERQSLFSFVPIDPRWSGIEPDHRLWRIKGRRNGAAVKVHRRMSRNELWAPQEVAVSGGLATRTRKEIAEKQSLFSFNFKTHYTQYYVSVQIFISTAKRCFFKIIVESYMLM